MKRPKHLVEACKDVNVKDTQVRSYVFQLGFFCRTFVCIRTM